MSENPYQAQPNPRGRGWVVVDTGDGTEVTELGVLDYQAADDAATELWETEQDA